MASENLGVQVKQAMQLKAMLPISQTSAIGK